MTIMIIFNNKKAKLNVLVYVYAGPTIKLRDI